MQVKWIDNLCWAVFYFMFGVIFLDCLFYLFLLPSEMISIHTLLIMPVVGFFSLFSMFLAWKNILRLIIGAKK